MPTHDDDAVSSLNPVKLKQVWEWECPNCHKPNYEQWVSLDLDPNDIDNGYIKAFARSFGMDEWQARQMMQDPECPMLGAMVTAPQVLCCHSCMAIYRSEIDDEDPGLAVDPADGWTPESGDAD